MDFGRAFSFVFQDPEWVKKILIGGLITLIPFVGGFIVYGYMFEIVRRVYLAEAGELPAWDDIGGYLVRGFLLYVAVLIWMLPAILLGVCAIVPVSLALGATGDDALAALAVTALVGVIFLVVLVILVWAVAFWPVIAGRYAVERRFGAMFEVGQIIAEARRVGIAPLLILLLVAIVAQFVAGLGLILCLIGVIFTSFYAYVVMAHGAGQVYRRARGLDAALPEAF